MYCLFKRGRARRDHWRHSIKRLWKDVQLVASLYITAPSKSWPAETSSTYVYAFVLRFLQYWKEFEVFKSTTKSSWPAYGIQLYKLATIWTYKTGRHDCYCTLVYLGVRVSAVDNSTVGVAKKVHESTQKCVYCVLVH